MKTKLEVTMTALVKLQNAVDAELDSDIYDFVRRTLEIVESIPEETCGTCRFFRKKKNLEHECQFYPQFPCESKSDDFCSKWDLKEN